jgi:uncharacterized membrane protein YidH (DUF202 family)
MTTPFYKVVYAKNAEDLAIKVNSNLQAVFVCKGGVSLAIVGRSKYQQESVQVAQAMIYYGESK